MLAGLHYEDIKASIRKKWGSLSAFEQSQGLPRGGVNDWGRGKTSARVQRAIEHHLTSIISPVALSDNPELTTGGVGAHRLNRQAA